MVVIGDQIQYAGRLRTESDSAVARNSGGIRVRQSRADPSHGARSRRRGLTPTDEPDEGSFAPQQESQRYGVHHDLRSTETGAGGVADVVMVGAAHGQAPLQLIEELAVRQDQLPAALDGLRRAGC